MRDETGDRRFWVVPVCNIDLQTLISLPEEWFIQLWAEIYTFWKMFPQGFRLTAEERDQLDRSNQSYREMLPGEEEILQAFNWELPIELWGQFTPAEIKQFLFRNERITAQQIGRALAKLAREDSRIEYAVNSRSRVKLYLLPLIKSPPVQI